MGDLVQMMEELMALVIISTIALNFAAAKVMGVFRSGGEPLGDAPIPSTIIGSIVSGLILWFANLSLAGLVVGVIVTVVANFLITKYIYPILDEKTLDMEEKFRQKKDNRK